MFYYTISIIALLGIKSREWQMISCLIEIIPRTQLHKRDVAIDKIAVQFSYPILKTGVFYSSLLAWITLPAYVTTHVHPRRQINDELSYNLHWRSHLYAYNSAHLVSQFLLHLLYTVFSLFLPPPPLSLFKSKFSPSLSASVF